MKLHRFNVLSTCFVIFDCWRKTVEFLGCHTCPSGGGASIEEDGDGGGGLKRNYDGDMGSFRVLSSGGLVIVVVQGTRRRLGFHQGCGDPPNLNRVSKVTKNQRGRNNSKPKRFSFF